MWEFQSKGYDLEPGKPIFVSMDPSMVYSYVKSSCVGIYLRDTLDCFCALCPFPYTFVLASKLYPSILHRECYCTL